MNPGERVEKYEITTRRFYKEPYSKRPSYFLFLQKKGNSVLKKILERIDDDNPKKSFNIERFTFLTDEEFREIRRLKRENKLDLECLSLFFKLNENISIGGRIVYFFYDSNLNRYGLKQSGVIENVRLVDNHKYGENSEELKLIEPLVLRNNLDGDISLQSLH